MRRRWRRRKLWQHYPEGTHYVGGMQKPRPKRKRPFPRYPRRPYPRNLEGVDLEHLDTRWRGMVERKLREWYADYPYSPLLLRRLVCGVTQADLARAVGCSQQFMDLLEKGRRRAPSDAAVRKRVAEFLEAPAARLFPE